MYKPDWMLRGTLALIAVLLGVIALRPFFEPDNKVLAQSGRFDHVVVVSPTFVYKGSQGLLVMDRRNANIWFIPKGLDSYQNMTFQNPVYLNRLPFEKLDQAPQ